jgi:hypothetical protein
MRLRADIFVSAYIRRCEVENVVAMLRKRGAAEAGAIFVKVDRLDGTAALYGPAPQTETAELGVDRLWTRMHEADFVPVPDVEARLVKEQRFDPDLWIIETEDRAGRCFLDLAPQ